jgi:hypothetical protein
MACKQKREKDGTAVSVAIYKHCITTQNMVGSHSIPQTPSLVVV